MQTPMSDQPRPSCSPGERDPAAEGGLTQGTRGSGAAARGATHGSTVPEKRLVQAQAAANPVTSPQVPGASPEDNTDQETATQPRADATLGGTQSGSLQLRASGGKASITPLEEERQMLVARLIEIDR